MLSEESIQALTEAFARDPSPVNREKLIEAHLYIARIIAKKFSGRGVEYDDLFQVASLALVKALDRYQPSAGVRFATYATPTMVGEVRNYFRDRARLIRLPRQGAALLRQIELARDALCMKLSHMPRVDELAAHLGVTEDEILLALETGSAAQVASLESPEGSDEEAPTVESRIGAEDAGYSLFENRDAVESALSQLDERQRRIIRLRYFDNLSQQEVSVRIGTSQMTVSREERKALTRMREFLGISPKGADK